MNYFLCKPYINIMWGKVILMPGLYTCILSVFNYNIHVVTYIVFEVSDMITCPICIFQEGHTYIAAYVAVKVLLN